MELEELRADDSDELEWEETARWIKFEEDVEADSGRWGRPHVSALAFHSLVDLRKGLKKGVLEGYLFYDGPRTRVYSMFVNAVKCTCMTVHVLLNIARFPIYSYMYIISLIECCSQVPRTMCFHVLEVCMSFCLNAICQISTQNISTKLH